ncbi:MAG: diguanylate cyclase [Candidatus Nanopelagicales bacterium]
MTGDPGASGRSGGAAHRFRLPRLARTVMGDLRLWMVLFGFAIGVTFPYVMVALGVPADISLRPQMFAATLLAGLAVAQVNYWLARGVVGSRLQVLAMKMRRVEESLMGAAASGDWSDCDPARCLINVESDDDLGQVGMSFNRLVDRLAASHRVAAGVSAVSEALAAHLDLHDLADATLSELSARTGCEGAALLSVANGRVALAGSFGISDPARVVSAEPVLRVLRSGEPVLVTLPADVVVTSALVDAVPHEVRIIPIRTGVVTVGVLLLAWLAPPGKEVTTVLDASLAGLGVGLNNALNHENLQRVAALDPLTGWYNRRFGLQRLAEEFSRSSRSGEPLGVLMMDLDHFKHVNDTYGHLVGDRVLQAVTRAARQSLREGDVSIRYGGEEFLLILPAAGLSDLGKAAERVRRAVAEAEIRESGQRIPITVSIGGACLPDGRAATPTDLIGLADSAVYAAKTGGRDRYVIS